MNGAITQALTANSKATHSSTPRLRMDRVDTIAISLQQHAPAPACYRGSGKQGVALPADCPSGQGSTVILGNLQNLSFPSPLPVTLDEGLGPTLHKDLCDIQMLATHAS